MARRASQGGNAFLEHHRLFRHEEATIRRTDDPKLPVQKPKPTEVAVKEEPRFSQPAPPKKKSPRPSKKRKTPSAKSTKKNAPNDDWEEKKTPAARGKAAAGKGKGRRKKVAKRSSPKARSKTGGTVGRTGNSAKSKKNMSAYRQRALTPQKKKASSKLAFPSKKKCRRGTVDITGQDLEERLTDWMCNMTKSKEGKHRPHFKIENCKVTRTEMFPIQMIESIGPINHEAGEPYPASG